MPQKLQLYEKYRDFNDTNIRYRNDTVPLHYNERYIIMIQISKLSATITLVPLQMAEQFLINIKNGRTVSNKYQNKNYKTPTDWGKR